MEVNVQETPPDKSRKRYANPEQWNVNKKKAFKVSMLLFLGLTAHRLGLLLAITFINN